MTSNPIFVPLLGTACVYRKSLQTLRWLPHGVIAMGDLMHLFVFGLVLLVEQTLQHARSRHVGSQAPSKAEDFQENGWRRWSEFPERKLSTFGRRVRRFLWAFLTLPLSRSSLLTIWTADVSFPKQRTHYPEADITRARCSVLHSFPDMPFCLSVSLHRATVPHGKEHT